MVCIFYDGEVCLAQPRTIHGVNIFKPDNPQKGSYCSAETYPDCQRYRNYVARLKRAKQKQETHA